ncbi:hypothetical protein FNV43_RR22174 [Rhamnella rubrinervis]|uniref:Zinc beta-ribbon domain-containing protein n=1 Tax=Rhamnella rubrinervis TaxID=2594499 RepID=A0A8K0GMX2_9ROSA|nr:hypothetical protein FNV43_RR22174 [Rhamnella rubrinervis]
MQKPMSFWKWPRPSFVHSSKLFFHPCPFVLHQSTQYQIPNQKNSENHLEMEASIHVAEAKRWLTTAVKLLTTRDLHGTRSFAIRARESYPGLDAAEEIIAVAETLIAGECRINHQHDCTGDLLSSSTRRRTRCLTPDEAFRLVAEAWSVLSNPSKKVIYDSELNVHSRFELGTGSTQTPTQTQTPAQTQLHGRQFLQKDQPQPVRRSARNKDGRTTAGEEVTPTINNVAESTRSTRSARPRQTESTQTTGSEVASFWTACPYCYILYEYPKVYEECALRCQNCKRAFHAAMIAPPVTGTKDTYFCCWGFFPLGFTGKTKDTSGSANWMPISPMFACPLQNSGRGKNVGASNRSSTKFIYADDDDDVFIEISDQSDDDSDDEWGSDRRKRGRNSKAKGSAANFPKRTPSERLKRGNQNAEELDNTGNGETLDGVVNGTPMTDLSKKAAAMASNVKKKGKAKWGRLDLNVEFSNEVEEPAPGMSEGNGNGAGSGAGNGAGNEGDNTEGIEFFEGLDEFLNSLPILKG